jgi:multidrug efflux pump subunit AcrB
VANAILQRLEILKGRLIPDNVHASITRNYGKTANDKVNELLAAMWWAALAVSLLCWITLSARPALVVITVIPLVILITIWSAWVLERMFPTQTQVILNIINRLSDFYVKNVVTNNIINNLH